jgi:hypothetical protein
MTGKIVVQQTGLVYRNPKPYLQSRMAYHPSLISLGDGEFLATFDVAQAVEALDYHTIIVRSRDDARTWCVEGPLLTAPPAATTHTIRTSKLVDGTLVGFGGLHHRSLSEEGLVNRETGGFVPTDLFIVRSFDGGHSWSAPELIDPPLVGPSWEICHPVVELRNGRWLAPTATWKGWNGENPSGEQSVVLISDDGGKSWPIFGRTFDGRREAISHLEQSVIELQDGRILDVCWVFDMRTGRTYPTKYAVSADNGETFSEPLLTGFYAETCKVIQLFDGRLLCAYRRHDQPGLWATLAELEGNKWKNIVHVPLWQGHVSGSEVEGKGADKLSALKLGYPSLCQINEREVLLLFWCEEDCITNIRWIRLQID